MSAVPLRHICPASAGLSWIERFAASAPIGVAVLDREMRYVLVNPAVQAMHGLPASESLGRTVGELFPDIGRTIVPYVQSAFAGTPVTKKVTGMTHRDASQLATWIAHYFPVEGDHGERFVAVVAQEITDREMQRRATRVANRRLKSQNELLSTLANGMAHDLKTPLATAILQLEMSRDACASCEARASIDDAIGVLRHGAETVSGLLRLASAMRVPSAEIVETRLVVERAWTAVGSTMEERGGGTLRVEGELPLVMGDEALLADLFQNLFDNAAKHGAAPGEPVRVVVRGSVDDHRAFIEVCDGGGGVAPAERERIFGVYAKGNGSPGLGLGLAIVERIAQVHDGSVTVLPNEPRGTRFVVELRAADIDLIGDELPGLGEIRRGHAVAPDTNGAGGHGGRINGAGLHGGGGGGRLLRAPGEPGA